MGPFPLIGLAEARQKALPDNRKVHEVAVALEVEPVAPGAGASHGDDVRQIAILAGADERHGCAAPRVLDHPQREIRRRDRLEAKTCVVVGTDDREEERDRRAFAGRAFQQTFDERAGMSAAAVGRRGEQRTDAGDSQRTAVERGVEGIQLGARQHLAPLDERKALQMSAPPGRRELARVVTPVRGAAQAVVPDRIAVVQNLLKVRTFDDRKICHGSPKLYGGFLNVPDRRPV